MTAKNVDPLKIKHIPQKPAGDGSGYTLTLTYFKPLPPRAETTNALVADMEKRAELAKQRAGDAG